MENKSEQLNTEEEIKPESIGEEIHQEIIEEELPIEDRIDVVGNTLEGLTPIVEDAKKVGKSLGKAYSGFATAWGASKAEE